MGHIVVGTISLLQQRLYILPKAVCLTLYILGEHDFALVVNARRTRDEDVGAVTIVHTRASLEADTIVAGAVQVRRSIEMVYLFGLDTGNAVVVHLRQDVRILLASTNTR